MEQVQAARLCGSGAVSAASSRAILLTLYSVVLLGGTTGTIMMLRIMFKRNSHSMMSTIILNVIVLHSVLLVSLPFRLSYYGLVVWEFGSFTCRVVSSIIYGHMYFTFVFYVAIVVLHLLIYFKKLQIHQLQKYHAVVLSITIWVVGSLIYLPILFLQYGIDPSYSEQQRCFEFYKDLSQRGFVIMNYSIIVIMMTTVVTLYSERENSELVLYNEVCVALTTVCCLDMLCFAGGIIH
ncbi:PREDICTED: probable G-protein coupled receptor 141 [Galeopterus variegatus]|uniref:Probable G-protein coupled receptor 141 n=1 Tax=Galeopterus variegatus TaxID=482537 RepID=A0ABM0RYH0_GALVR|nr:PREDICTED: probable G-protein coupled receptor 141 [Galeopterus variegatus]